jgi:hypothetical protein
LRKLPQQTIHCGVWHSKNSRFSWIWFSHGLEHLIQIAINSKIDGRVTMKVVLFDSNISQYYTWGTIWKLTYYDPCKGHICR